MQQGMGKEQAYEQVKARRPVYRRPGRHDSDVAQVYNIGRIKQIGRSDGQKELHRLNVTFVGPAGRDGFDDRRGSRGCGVEGR